MVLSQKEKYRSAEQNRKSRDKATHLWTYYFDKGGKNIKWRRTVSSISGAGKTDQLRVKA